MLSPTSMEKRASSSAMRLISLYTASNSSGSDGRLVILVMYSCQFLLAATTARKNGDDSAGSDSSKAFSTKAVASDHTP